MCNIGTQLNTKYTWHKHKQVDKPNLTLFMVLSQYNITLQSECHSSY